MLATSLDAQRNKLRMTLTVPPTRFAEAIERMQAPWHERSGEMFELSMRRELRSVYNLALLYVQERYTNASQLV